MNCEQIGELLPDYLEASLSEKQKAQVEQHLAQCADCSEGVALWKKLAQLPIEQPSPALRARFEAALDAYREGRAQEAARFAVPGKKLLWALGGGSWTPAIAAGVACAVILVVAAFFAGKYTSRPDANSQEMTEMRSELSNMRQLVVLSMLEQESAVERLQGVAYGAREKNLDPKIVSALAHTLRYDSSIDVRLAAVDALSGHRNQPQVRESLVEALEPQQSPLVQIALIDVLVDSRDASAVQQLRRLQEDPNINPEVRQRAAWAVQKLS
jgi:Putative zinc-finger/HEAT repeats